MEIINITDEIIEVNVTEAVVNVVTQNGAYPLPSNVFSVFGRVGYVVGQIGDYTTSIVEEGTNLYYTQARFDTAFGNKTTTDLDEGTNLYYTDARSRAAISETITGINYDSASGIFSLASGYVIPTQAMLDAKQDDLNGTGIVKSTGGTISYLTDNTANWDAAYNDKINSASVSGTTTKTLTLNQQDGGTITASWSDIDTGLTSVGLSMPAAFSVANSPLTANGTLSVTGAGTTLQYVRGDGSLATFPSLTGFVPYTGATANVNLGTYSLTAADLVINHASGSGVAASITKGGSGEALTVVKTSGSGNAASITGGVTLLDELHLNTDLADAYIASAATWNAKQNAITLTTTGTSGAATFVGDTLNIPQYQGVLTNPVTGTGTTNTLPKFTGASSIGNSNITDTGSLITLGSNTRINTGQDGLRIGADTNGVINSANTSKRGRINIPQYGNPNSIPVGIISGATDSASNSIIIGGTQGGFALAADAIIFQIGNTYNATSGTEVARFASNGALGIGTTSLTGYSLRVSKNITGATTAYGIVSDGQIQSDATSGGWYFRTAASTQAASYTTSFLNHYVATQGTFGAGSTVTNQYGFQVDATLTGATNNYGFFGNIASGTNRWNLYMNGTANNYMAGSLGIGSTSLTQYSLRVGKAITGATFAGSILSNAAVQSDVTSDGISFYSLPSTAASAFTLANLTHFYAQQSTIGAGSAVTNQSGFWATSSITGATNNYGFRGSVPSGTGRWNLYMEGTAANYMAGQVGIGTTNIDEQLTVSGNIHVDGSGSGSGTFGPFVEIGRANGPRLNATQEGADNDIQGLAIFTKNSGVTADNPIERIRVKATGQMRFVPLASDPSGAEAGDVYYNSTISALKLYDGTQWRTITVI